MNRLESIFINNINVPANRRGVDPMAVQKLATSISEIGLQYPITCWSPDLETMRLVAGAHRLEACKSLGWMEIPCFLIESGTEEEAEMWEISENLHRSELTALQRSEQIARWIELCDRKQEKSLSAQLGPTVNRDGKRKGAQHMPRGINAASRELKLERKEAHRAVAIDSLSERAKQAAIEARLDNNQSALLKAARQPTEEKQVEVIKAHIHRDAPPQKRPIDHLKHWWDKASNDERAAFRQHQDA